MSEKNFFRESAEDLPMKAGRLLRGEDQNVEFKESWQDEYLKWICGFANAQGGVLYVGVRNNGEVCGVGNAKKLIEDLPNKIRDTMGLAPSVDLLQIDDSTIVRVTVEAASFPTNLRGVYYLRRGATNQTLSGNALTQFILKRTGKTWDGVVVDSVSEDDLDKESFDIFKREAIRSGRISEDDLKLSRVQLLEHLNLIEDGKLKRAAVLLFYRNPEKWITGSFVKIGFFENDADLRYQDEIHGSLMIQADRVIELIYTKYLKADISYDNVTRIEHYPFPKDAVREAVFNALVHQDFAACIPVQISVYEDKLYISNDCQFPPSWTAETLMGKHRSCPLNPDIANTFFRAGYIESWGRGVEKICRICHNYGIPDPEYTVHPNDIMLCFKTDSHKAQEDSGHTENHTENTVDTILKILADDPRVTIARLCEMTRKSRPTITEHIAKLKAMNRIRRVGPDKGGHWEVVHG